MRSYWARRFLIVAGLCLFVIGYSSPVLAHDTPPISGTCPAGHRPIRDPDGVIVSCADNTPTPSPTSTPTGGAGSTSDLPPNPATSLNVGDAKTLPSVLINTVLTPVLTIIGFFAVFYIVLAGWKFVSSNGDPKGAEEARGRLTFAIVGLVIVILAVTLAQLIDKLILGKSGVF